MGHRMRVANHHRLTHLAGVARLSEVLDVDAGPAPMRDPGLTPLAGADGLGHGVLLFSQRWRSGIASIPAFHSTPVSGLAVPGPPLRERTPGTAEQVALWNRVVFR